MYVFKCNWSVYKMLWILYLLSSYSSTLLFAQIYHHFRCRWSFHFSPMCKRNTLKLKKFARDVLRKFDTGIVRKSGKFQYRAKIHLSYKRKNVYLAFNIIDTATLLCWFEVLVRGECACSHHGMEIGTFFTSGELTHWMSWHRLWWGFCISICTLLTNFI